jgi:hypothetical protein
VLLVLAPVTVQVVPIVLQVVDAPTSVDEYVTAGMTVKWAVNVHADDTPLQPLRLITTFL